MSSMSEMMETVHRAIDPAAPEAEAGEEVGKSTLAERLPSGGGSPLTADVRARMEPRLGADLSGVRIHLSAESAGAAKNLGARAFAAGNDVHFNAGQFAPGTKEGDRLLAHELTHVVQGQRSGVQRKAEDGEEETESPEVSSPDEPAEKEADAVADKVADGLHAEGGEAGEAEKVEEEPAPISAKLEGSVGRKLYAAWPKFGGGGQQQSKGPAGAGAKSAQPGPKAPMASPVQIKAAKGVYLQSFVQGYMVVPAIESKLAAAQAKLKKDQNDANAKVVSNLWSEKKDYASQAKTYRDKLSYFAAELKKVGLDPKAVEKELRPVQIDASGKVDLESIYY